MHTVKIKDCIIGEGMPKICVPLMGKTIDELKEELALLKGSGADLVEWRMDEFQGVEDLAQVEEALCLLREQCGRTGILATFRTMQEGGKRACSLAQYLALYEGILSMSYVDLIDVELSMGEEMVKKLLAKAQKQQVKVVLSSHDFEKTPSIKDIIARLCKMQEAGADICKIAVMPQNKKDVVTLLEATFQMKEIYADRPIITMSMAKDGVISRICGEFFGSALTFASLKEASAPGQVPIKTLQELLASLHTIL